MDPRRQSVELAVRALADQVVIVGMDGDAINICKGALQVDGNTLRVMGKPYSVIFEIISIERVTCSSRCLPEIALCKPRDHA